MSERGWKEGERRKEDGDICREREIGGREIGIYVERGRSEREGRFTGRLSLSHSNMYVSVASHGQLTIEKFKAIF